MIDGTKARAIVMNGANQTAIFEYIQPLKQTAMESIS